MNWLPLKEKNDRSMKMELITQKMEITQKTRLNLEGMLKDLERKGKIHDNAHFVPQTLELKKAA